MLLAHREVCIDGNVLEQSLEDHLYKVGMMASEIGSLVGLSSFMKLAGYLHDVGKADRLFQDYICCRTKQQVNHSSSGGRVLNDYIQKDLGLKYLQQTKGKFVYFQEILTYVILAHHGLFDLVSYDGSEYKICERLQYDKTGNYHYIEDVAPFVLKFDHNLQIRGEKSIILLINEAYEEFVLIYSKLSSLSKKNYDKEKQKEEKEYYISCFTRLCLSILKDADIYDSSNAFHEPKQHLCTTNEKDMIWKNAFNRIEYMYNTYEEKQDLSSLNKTRNELAKIAKEAALINKNGIFKLELPTGAGKTKLSLRYSITNAKEHNRNRVFYVTAFLTVLEQNAADIRSILLMDDVILEHHSNFVEDTDIIFENEYDKAEYNPQAYLKESWENPIILTTMVQFLNTLFKERASNIRRFCKLINSVIIIDEVQSLPLKVLSNFNLMMNFMKEIMHCNIVHCTATQPVLDSKAMTYPIYYGNEEDQFASIINIETKLLECFHRVDFYNLTGNNANLLLSTEKISDYIQKELMLFNTCLVVLNTKAAVLKLYDYLIKNISGVEVIYLTTNLCAAHRLNVISSMKEKLKYNRNESGQHKLICVSTQLIEAGVDVDFDIVFRSLSGVDSIIQCAGRCNREGKLEFEGKMVHGKLFIMRYSEENLSYLPDIKASVDATEYAIRSVVEQEDDSLTIERLQLPYFNKYYISNRDKLDYVDMKKGSNMVEELGKNDPDRYAYTIAKKPNKKHMMFQAFLRAAENFHLIDEGTTAIIVPYQNQELLQNLHLAMNKKDYRRIKEILKKLQRYSVNVYLSPKLEPYIYKNEEYNIYFLSEPYYHENKGISTVGLADLIY